MQLSLSTEYAIHSLIYLALQPRGKVTLVSEVARAQGVSETYLAKVFQQLVKAGLVISYRGAKGGFALALPPNQISLAQIIGAIEGRQPILRCVVERRSCELGTDCPIHGTVDRVERLLWETLEQTKLSDLIEEMRNRGDKAHWLAHLLQEERAVAPPGP
ncbi:MAG: Rrf2 family transcriptional regulator [candidate division KSB1 bacterium]|nr:Rrf2 family transcriptional regulator [candidate division KSB1 bacterium]